MTRIGVPAGPARLIELDSLRGLAALSVVVHYLEYLWAQEVNPTSSTLHSLTVQFLNFGNEAVLLFFVLSGFVLSLPAINGRPQTYFTFTVRRVFRIYVPYLAAIAVSVAGASWLHGSVTQSDWFHQSWSQPVSWRLVGQHLLFVGIYDVNQFDNPIWSLVHEMRVSLLFPALCWLVLRLKSRWSLVIAGGISGIAFVLQKWVGALDWNLRDSIHFAALFVLGIFLARERGRLGAWFHRFPRLVRILIPAACLWLYLFAGPELAGAAIGSYGLTFQYIAQWLTAFGAGGLILISLNVEFWRKILAWPPIHLLGRMSYSLYLWHFVVLLYCVHLLYGKLPFGAILGLAFVLSMVVSWCSYRWIELPSIAIGRKLSDIRRTRPLGVNA